MFCWFAFLLLLVSFSLLLLPKTFASLQWHWHGREKSIADNFFSFVSRRCIDIIRTKSWETYYSHSINSRLLAIDCQDSMRPTDLRTTRGCSTLTWKKKSTELFACSGSLSVVGLSLDTSIISDIMRTTIEMNEFTFLRESIVRATTNLLEFWWCDILELCFGHKFWLTQWTIVEGK